MPEQDRPSVGASARRRLWPLLLGESLHIDDHDVVRRARLCASLGILLLCTSTLVGIVRFSEGLTGLSLVNLGHVFVGVATLLTLRAGRPGLASNLLCGTVVLTMSFVNVVTFGRLPGTFIGSGAIMVPVILLTGPLAGGAWFGLLMLSMVAATGLAHSPLSPPLMITDAFQQQHWYAVGVVTCLIAGGAALLYEHLRSGTLRELEAARKAATAAAEAKGAFLATMSHEIRTPLNGVFGMAQLLSDQDLDADTRTLSNNLLASSKALLRVINGVLDLSKMEAGRLELELAEVGIDELAEQTVALFRFDPKAQDLNLTLDYRGPRPCFVETDATRLQQVLNNLVANAIKFTEQGHVCLEVTATPVEGMMEVTFGVRDTGIGIASDALPHLFEPFRQADSSTTRRFGGTGLGLSISHQLVERLGGRLQVQTTDGEGSYFHFTLRLSQARNTSLLPGPMTSMPVSARLRGHVLVAEDNRVNRAIVASMLEQLGLQATMANDGVEALEQARRQHFDCILMDAMMPRMDGYECTRALRELDGYAKTPIIALTANTFPEDRERCLQSGMDDFLSKPLRRESLEQKLARWLGAA